jgi:outer membrane lipoprotein SlyB
LLGHQVGSGRGNTAATVIGAAGGAYAGHEVEKRVKTEKDYHVSVRTEDGRTHRFVFDTAPDFSVGDRGRVIDGKLVHG